MLRMKKVATYVAEKLELQLPRGREDSIAGSRRPSVAPPSSSATATGSTGATMAMSKSTSSAAAPRLPVPHGASSLAPPPAADAAGGAGAVAGAGEEKESTTLPAHEAIEILCDEVLLPPELTLVQCRRFLWKQSGDIKLEYRLKQQAAH